MLKIELIKTVNRIFAFLQKMPVHQYRTISQEMCWFCSTFWWNTGKPRNVNCLLARSFTVIPQRPTWSSGSITEGWWRGFDSLSVWNHSCLMLQPAFNTFTPPRMVLTSHHHVFCTQISFYPCLSCPFRLKLQHITLSVSMGGIQLCSILFHIPHCTCPKTAKS